MFKFFTSICISFLLGLSSLGAQVMISASSSSPVDCGNSTTQVDVVVTNFNNIASMQFAMSWDTSALQFQGVTNNFSVTDFFVPNASLVSEGTYSFSWASFDLNGASFADNAAIFSFTFDVTGMAGASSNFDFISLVGLSIEVSSSSTGPLTIGTDVIFIPTTIFITDTTNPSITCPSDTTVYNGAAIIGGIAPTATDDCAIDSVNYVLTGATTGTGLNDASGTTFSQGITNVAYTATDFGSNNDGCAFSVEVLDTTTSGSDVLTFTPVINYDCTSDTITIDINVTNFDSITSMQYAIQWDTAVIDYIENTSFLPGFPPNALFAGDGLLVIVWATPPVSDPDGITLPDGSTIYTIQYVLENGIQTPLVDIVSLPTLQIEITQFGTPLNSSEYIFAPNVLNVNDTELPMQTSCPTSFSVNNDAGTCAANVTWTDATFTDNCGIDNVMASAAPGLFPVGDSIVTYTATDIAGNMATCSFTVTVVDNENPNITSCPGAISVNADAGLCGATPALGTPTAIDNCGVASINNNAPAIFPVGTTTVTWTVLDAANNSTTCSQMVTVIDVEDPVITSCPGAVNVSNDAGLCSASPSLGTPIATDNCGVVSTTNDAPANFPVGMTTVTWTVADAAGNDATCTQIVTVADTEDPVITSCPGAVNVTADAGLCTASPNLGTPSSTDNCGVVSTTNDAPANFPVGMTTVTWTVADAAGNSTTCTQVVTVTETEDPVITSCPGAINANNNAGLCGATVSLGTPTATDNCGVMSISNDAPTNFPVGMTTVTWTVTDDNNNTTSCTQLVTITDNENPTVSCPSLDAFDADAGMCSVLVTNDLTPTATDNCGIATITYTITGATTGSGNNNATNTTFNVGLSTLTYTVTDVNGNVNTCFVVVQVNDAQAPTLTCPANLNIFVPSTVADTVINNIGATATDNCMLSTLTYNFIGATMGSGNNDASGTSFSQGTTTITYTATDTASNVNTCSFDITVTPVTTELIGCPANQAVNTDAGICGAVVTGIAPTLLVPSSDIASLTYTLTGETTGSGSNDASGTTFNLGITTIEYLVTDNMGNMDSCAFTITVSDMENPTWAGCPSTTSVNINTDDCRGVATWTIPVPSDNCGVNQVFPSHEPGDTFNLGTTTVTYAALDMAGNLGTCAFNVTVTDATPPIAQSCPDSIFVDATGGSCDGIATWTEPVFTDCQTFITTSTHNSGTTFPAGSTTVVYTATDDSGNVGTCTFVVTIQDATPPMITCPSNITVPSLTSDCSAQVTWPAPTATDDCDSDVTLSVSMIPGSSFPVGTTTVTYTATDDSGNMTTCSFDVTVQDQFAPTVDCPNNVVMSVDGTVLLDESGIILSTNTNMNCDGVNVEYTIPTATDNCGIETIELTAGQVSGGVFPIGTTTVTYVATDSSGNFTPCSFDVIVNPLSIITVDFESNDTLCVGESVQLTTNAANATFSWSHASSAWTSNDPNPIRDNITEADAGIYSVTVTYTNSGCTTTGTNEFFVLPAPSITATYNGPLCNGEDIELNLSIDPTATPTSFSWTGPNGYTSDQQNPTIVGPGTAEIGLYEVTVAFDNGCQASTSIDVSLANLPAPAIDAECGGNICLGSTCVLQGTQYVPAPDFYNWSAIPATNAGLPVNTENDQITVQPTAPGTYVYNYSVEIDQCISAEATAIIFVHGAPVSLADTFDVAYETTFSGNVITNDTFTTNLDLSPVNMVTQPANGTVLMNDDGTFTYTPNNGFIGTDQFIYEICYDCDQLLCDNAVVNLNVTDDNEECIIPTLITPNRDQVNDALVINCLLSGSFPNNEISIYNQWGDEVFTAAPYQNNWEGTFDGKDLPDGTYYFVFRLDTNAELVKGFITIFR